MQGGGCENLIGLEYKGCNCFIVHQMTKGLTSVPADFGLINQPLITISQGSQSYHHSLFS